MLVVSPWASTNNGDKGMGMESHFLATGGGGGDDSFSGSLSDGDFLVDIDLDDLFIDFGDVDLLPELEIDSSEYGASVEVKGSVDPVISPPEEIKIIEANSTPTQTEAGVAAAAGSSSVAATADRSRKAVAAQAKSSQGKKKVDWTPELHRRFVQAVEQLGFDKAVPSRILEIMGIDCLTRHNVASHLQKYRSHRKHLLSKEKEMASWTQPQQAAFGGGHGGTIKVGHKRQVGPWMTTTLGFPPPPPPPIQHFRPLHVWGHPTVGGGHGMVHMWLKQHLGPSPADAAPAPPGPPPPPPPTWAPQPPLHTDPSFWHYPRGPSTPWFPAQTLAAPMRFPAPPPPPFPGIPLQPMYRPENQSALSRKKTEFDSHPSDESIDAAVEDVLSKPWLPMPLGLKPPPLESVLVELQRQGVSSVPPTCTAC